MVNGEKTEIMPQSRKEVGACVGFTGKGTGSLQYHKNMKIKQMEMNEKTYRKPRRLSENRQGGKPPRSLVYL
jgi:hypothetical protein